MLNKNFKLFACAALCVVMLVGVNSCKKDDDRDPYEGSWKVVDKEDGKEFQTYTVTITKSKANKNDVILQGFFGEPTIGAIATITGNSFTIPQQSFSFSNGMLGFSGSGRKEGNRLSYSMQVTITSGGSVALGTIQSEATKL